ncbi:hypothetical protein PQX77_019027 [Marasmius sp. AFHP31]|nr:hypothetical protein PQX77_019027 [Marasmius sp. AFHP31]
MSTHFSNAQGWTIGAHANFQAVTGNSTIIHNHNNPEREDRVTLHGRTVRRVIDGDISFQRVLSSKILSVNVKPEGASTSTKSQVTIKVKKMEQTAKIYGYRGKFTATSLEPVDEKDRGRFKEVLKIANNVLEAAMCGRSALLKQVFAVAESENAMTLIAHDGGFPFGNLSYGCSKAAELANGDEFSNRYHREKEQIVFHYLYYTFGNAIQALRADETLRFPVTDRWSDWSLNVKNLTWRYDPASLCLNPPSERSLQPIPHPLPPLRQDALPRLNATEIIAHVEESFGDVLYLMALVGKRYIDLSDYARHGLLTLGTVVNHWKPGIVAHLPSTPSPEWFCLSSNPNVTVTCSSSGRVDLSFQKTGNVQVKLYFGWHIPEKDLHEVGFCLQGTFLDNPANHSTPAYLFVHPPPTEFVNNMHCIRYPFPDKPMYWSHDPQGRNTIAEEDQERFGIPGKLSLTEWIGDYWQEEHYTLVREHLRSRSYGLDGKRYAREHRHPELILADPHDTRIVEEYESLDPDVPETSPSPLASPLNSSFVKASVNLDTKHEDTPTKDAGAHWAKPGFLKNWCTFLFTPACVTSPDS